YLFFGLNHNPGSVFNYRSLVGIYCNPAHGSVYNDFSGFAFIASAGFDNFFYRSSEPDKYTLWVINGSFDRYYIFKIRLAFAYSIIHRFGRLYSAYHDM